MPRSQVHFGKFIGAYISGHYFFDIHPPFGKLVIALAAYSGGYRTTQPFEVIGEPFGHDINVFALRAAPATFGAAIVPLAYLLSRELGCSESAALLVARSRSRSGPCSYTSSYTSSCTSPCSCSAPAPPPLPPHAPA